jgi:L-fucose isomerase-like protein
MPNPKMTMGMIVGNRGFFPDHLAKSGREEMLRALTAAGLDVVALTPEESKYGALETRDEVRRCAELFKKNRERIDGIIVTLPIRCGTAKKFWSRRGFPLKPSIFRRYWDESRE